MKAKLRFLTIILILIFSSSSFILYSQDDLLSAKTLLENISENFKANVKDMKADVKWTQGNLIQEGKMLFKNPQKLRIDYSDPANQVICTNGYELWVYIPQLNLVLHQNVLEKEKVKNEDGDVETKVSPILINPVGFDKFLTEYSIQFNETKEKVSYKGTKVYQFKLIRWRTSKSGFNTMYLYVEESGLIREIRGITAAYRQITLEIENIVANTGISDLTFNYESPAHTSTIEDFITSEF